MKRALVSELRLGTQVKLAPQGKLYTIATCDRSKIYLRDAAGKDKAVSFQTTVYYQS